MSSFKGTSPDLLDALNTLSLDVQRRIQRAPSTWWRNGLLALFLLFLYTTFPGRHESQMYLKPLRCPGLNTTRIAVAVKTGATEARHKIPTQMRTTLACVENVHIFSDLSQNVEGYQVYDALDTVVDYTIRDNPDFKFYNRQKELWNKKHDVSELEGLKYEGDKEELAAWRLDKYKFIHVLEKTWARKPDLDWYFLIDADTYVLWDNMLAWLSNLDPNQPAYFGSLVEIDGTKFAHGGSGILLSRAAMRELLVKNKETARRWDDFTYDVCCGDLILGRALGERGITLQDVWPSMSGESIYSMPFGKATEEYWCGPALTMHHMKMGDMNDISAFERERKKSGEICLTSPLTHAEIFMSVLYNNFPREKSNWDNFSWDKGEFGKTGGISEQTPKVDVCVDKCTQNKKCVQWLHHDETCFMGMSFRRGYEKEGSEKGPWTSGWNRTRVEEWVMGQEECDEMKWPEQRVRLW